MRKIRRTWKVYAIIIIFCTILILQKNNLIYYIANMPKGYADNVWESNYTYEAAPYLEDFFGSEMTEYLSNSLLSNEVDDRLHEIAANYRKLNVIEKIKVIMNSKDNIFLKYYCDEGSIWDTWYQINLYPEVHTALSDTDIVISHVDKSGSHTEKAENVTNLVFFNEGWQYYGLAIRQGGQTDTQPYFVNWENENYMITLIEKNEQVIGMTVYKYCNVMTLIMNDSGGIDKEYWVCNVGSYSGELWPVIEKVYEGYWELPFSEMTYAQEDTVEMLQNEYGDISFEYRFPAGECKYKNYFLGLLKNDIHFDEIFEGKEITIDATGHFVTKYCTKDMKELYYYLFDMTGDGITDLCISDEREFIYVISYDEEKKRLNLWNGFDSTWMKLNGTCVARWNREGINQIYYEFEPNGELFRMTGFMEKEFLNKETQTGETAYVVSMPYYEENTDSAEKREMMQDQAYYVKDTGLYYFRVTKEQYEQLTEAYFQAEAEAAQNIKKVRYTYDEVISELSKLKVTSHAKIERNTSVGACSHKRLFRSIFIRRQPSMK